MDLTGNDSKGAHMNTKTAIVTALAAALILLKDIPLFNTGLLASFGGKETWNLEQLQSYEYASVNHATGPVTYYIIMEFPGDGLGVVALYMTVNPFPGASAVQPESPQSGIERLLISTAAP